LRFELSLLLIRFVDFNVITNKTAQSISKGRDVSSLFPDVVKNVVCQNIELKKLVYIYLVHYAESQSETALLAINTFQKGLENKNQLIRSMALRVMSSIRVRLISNLVVMAIKSAARDGSPYVRKTAAHAIPKVYRFGFLLMNLHLGFLTFEK